MSKIEIRSLTIEALDAFWQVVARRWPQATSGDLSPDREIRLKLAADSAIEEWIANNVAPDPQESDIQPTTQQSLVKIGYRFKVARPVDRFPDFVAPVGLTGTVTAANEGIWAKIDQHFPGGETWDNELYWETVEEFLTDSVAIP